MVNRGAKKINGLAKFITFFKKPFVYISGICTLLVTLGSISYSCYNGTVKINNAIELPEKLKEHVVYSEAKFVKHETEQKEEVKKINDTIKEHVVEQARQFENVEKRIDKLDNNIDGRMDKVEDKLYVIAQAVARIEKSTRSKEDSIATGEIVDSVNRKDKTEFVSYKPLSLNNNKEN